MFGHNKPRGVEPAEKTAELGYQVHSVFYTIQGEGPFAGLAAIFVRLTGCNLRCSWCDTEWNDDGDQRLDARELTNHIRRMLPPRWVAGNMTYDFDRPLIVLTGGEPCRWPLRPLIDALTEGIANVQIQVETAGTLFQECLLNDNVTTVISPKISRVSDKFYRNDSRFCHWKYVVAAGDASDDDGLPVADTQRSDSGPNRGGAMARPPRGAIVYLQPRDDQDAVKNAANLKHMTEIALKYGYRAGVQLHKLLGVE